MLKKLNFYRCYFYLQMFIDTLFYQFCSFFAGIQCFHPLCIIFSSVPFSVFWNLSREPHAEVSWFFYINLTCHLTNKERTGVFEKNIFLGGLGQKDPKMGLKRDFWMVLWIMLRKLNYRFFYSKKILFWFFQPIRGQNWL